MKTNTNIIAGERKMTLWDRTYLEQLIDSYTEYVEVARKRKIRSDMEVDLSFFSFMKWLNETKDVR